MLRERLYKARRDQRETPVDKDHLDRLDRLVRKVQQETEALRERVDRLEQLVRPAAPEHPALGSSAASGTPPRRSE